MKFKIEEIVSPIYGSSYAIYISTPKKWSFFTGWTFLNNTEYYVDAVNYCRRYKKRKVEVLDL